MENGVFKCMGNADVPYRLIKNGDWFGLTVAQQIQILSAFGKDKWVGAKLREGDDPRTVAINAVAHECAKPEVGCAFVGICLRNNSNLYGR